MITTAQCSSSISFAISANYEKRTIFWAHMTEFFRKWILSRFSHIPSIVSAVFVHSNIVESDRWISYLQVSAEYTNFVIIFSSKIFIKAEFLQNAYIIRFAYRNTEIWKIGAERNLENIRPLQTSENLQCSHSPFGSSKSIGNSSRWHGDLDSRRWRSVST